MGKTTHKLQCHWQQSSDRCSNLKEGNINMAGHDLPGTLHDLEKTAARHLWFHGPEENWEELTEQEGMRVFARGEGSTIWDVRGRTCPDILSVVNAC